MMNCPAKRRAKVSLIQPMTTDPSAAPSKYMAKKYMRHRGSAQGGLDDVLNRGVDPRVVNIREEAEGQEPEGEPQGIAGRRPDRQE